MFALVLVVLAPVVMAETADTIKPVAVESQMTRDVVLVPDSAGNISMCRVTLIQTVRVWTEFDDISSKFCLSNQRAALEVNSRILQRIPLCRSVDEVKAWLEKRVFRKIDTHDGGWWEAVVTEVETFELPVKDRFIGKR